MRLSRFWTPSSGSPAFSVIGIIRCIAPDTGARAATSLWIAGKHLSTEMSLSSILRAKDPRTRPVPRIDLSTSPGLEEASAEQVEAGTAVHLTLQQLQPVDLTLNRTVAPFQ